MTEFNIDRFVSMREACEFLGVKRDTLIKWITKDNLPAYKIGNLWKFKVVELNDWVKKTGQVKVED